MSKEKEELQDNDIEKYIKPSFFARIPSWVKILLLKYWAAGAAFFFFGMAAGFIWSHEDSTNDTVYLFLMLTLGYALISEYIVKQIVRLMRTSRDDTYYYNIINIKGALSFFAYLGYSILIILPTMSFFGFLADKGISLNFWTLTDGVDPFLFALMAVFLDFIYLFIKNAICNFIKKRKFKKTNEFKNKEL